MSENTLDDILAAIDKLAAEEPRKWVSPKVAGAIASQCQTAVGARIRQGTYLSIIYGNRRQILTSSIFDDMRARARASFAPSGELVKIRQPSSMYRRCPRPAHVRTAAELNALQHANQKRHREAGRRKAAATQRKQARAREAADD
jgi:hypothetical protein